MPADVKTSCCFVSGITCSTDWKLTNFPIAIEHPARAATTLRVHPNANQCSVNADFNPNSNAPCFQCPHVSTRIPLPKPMPVPMLMLMSHVCNTGVDVNNSSHCKSMKCNNATTTAPVPYPGLHSDIAISTTTMIKRMNRITNANPNERLNCQQANNALTEMMR